MPCSSLTHLVILIRKRYDLGFQSIAAVEMLCNVQTINIDFRKHFNISKQILFSVLILVACKVQVSPVYSTSSNKNIGYGDVGPYPMGV